MFKKKERESESIYIVLFSCFPSFSDVCPIFSDEQW